MCISSRSINGARQQHADQAAKLRTLARLDEIDNRLKLGPAISFEEYRQLQAEAERLQCPERWDGLS